MDDVGVNHGGLHVLVTEKFLDGADVVAVLEEMRGERMAKGVWGYGFVYSDNTGGLANCFLQNAFVEMVTPDFFGLGVNRARDGREKVLPEPFFGGVGVFSGEGVGQVDFAVAGFEVLLMNVSNGFEVRLQMRDQRIGEHGEAVFFAFAVADDDLVVTEVNILDAQTQTFHEAQAAAVEYLGHKLGNAGHFVDDGHGFLVGEDDGQGFGFLGADDVGGEGKVYFEDVAIEEDDGAECLILGGGGKLFLGGEVGDEGLDFFCAHIFGMAFVVEEDIAFDPIHICFFGAGGVVFGADGIADLFEEFFALRGGCGLWLHVNLFESGF